jgi:hypothetical protein
VTISRKAGRNLTIPGLSSLGGSNVGGSNEGKDRA